MAHKIKSESVERNVTLWYWLDCKDYHISLLLTHAEHILAEIEFVTVNTKLAEMACIGIKGFNNSKKGYLQYGWTWSQEIIHVTFNYAKCLTNWAKPGIGSIVNLRLLDPYIVML